MSNVGLPAHGGDIEWAERAFGIAAEDWLDLSTGIAPWYWPVPEVPKAVWRRLPPQSQTLADAAAQYYGCKAEQLLAIPGSQFMISRIPFEIPATCIAIPSPAYSEHEASWLRAGHEVVHYTDMQGLNELIDSNKVSAAVIVQPNNPSGALMPVEGLLAVQHRLWKKYGESGLLLVDEAFIDTQAQQSLCLQQNLANCLVLRSEGKFFGSAGVRLGFLFAQDYWRKRLQPLCEPWAVSHPAQWMGEQALRDSSWITLQLKRIHSNNLAMHKLLKLHFPKAKIASQGLFISVSGDESRLYEVFSRLAAQGVLTRFIPSSQGCAILRFGLPGDNLERFSRAINTSVSNSSHTI